MADTEHVKPGIGGWLLLPAAGLIGSAVGFAVGAVWLIRTLFTIELPRTPYAFPLMLLIVLQLFLLLTYTCVVTFSFLRAERAAPDAVVSALTTLLYCGALDCVIVMAVFGRPAMIYAVLCLAAPAIACGVGIPFFTTSKQVKATFVN